MKKRAFISAKNKDGLISFVNALLENSYEIIASSETAEFLGENNIFVAVAEDLFAGNDIHKAILANRSEPEDINYILENGIEPIDIVVVNMLNPVNVFGMEEDIYSLMEKVDINANYILRSAVKNFDDVVAVTSKDDYESIINEIQSFGEVSKETKLNMCHKAMDYLCRFDTIIADYMRTKVSTFAYPDIFNTCYNKQSELTEGDSTNYTAALYQSCLSDSLGLCDMTLLCGKPISFNNYKDIDFAVELLKEFKDQSAAVIAKHSTVCGVAIGESISDCFVKASRTDSNSNAGASIVLNGVVDKTTALEIIKNPYRAVVAPSFEEEAIDICSSKENLSVFKYDVYASDVTGRKFEVKKIQGGLLMRNVNNISVTVNECRCVTETTIEDSQIADLMFAWKIAKHTPSDSIIVVKDGQTVGVSTGQTNRIVACQSAVNVAGNKSEKAVVASDGTIGFEEIIKICTEAKISAIIQPGGSNKDEELIAKCNENEIAMMFTNIRFINN